MDGQTDRQMDGGGGGVSISPRPSAGDNNLVDAHKGIQYILMMLEFMIQCVACD